MSMSIAGAVAAAILLWMALGFNLLVRRRNHVAEAWSDVDVQLKRRHDLVPSLVESVKGYRAHEASLFEEIATRRTQAQAARGVPEAGAVENGLSRQLRSLFALAEAYPDLKADTQFRQLSASLVEIEDQIQYARRYYNGTVRDFNILVQSFPGLLLAQWFGFTPAAFFEVESSVERRSPGVSL